MKYFVTILAAVLLSLSASAQAPLRFNYQAIIRNSSGALMSNQAIGMRISLLQGTATGPAVYVERHTITTNANGLATLDIGGGTVVSGSLATVTWGGGLFFLKTETDPTGGTNYTITATSQLLSVPYAMHATYAQFAGGHHIGEFFGGGIVFYVWRDHLGIEHGLIASLDDLSGSLPWASPEITSSIATSTLDGAANTAQIVAQLGIAAANSAAGRCDAYSGGSYNDWYLPASQELQLLQSQTIAINAVLMNDNNPLSNGFVPSAMGYAEYWSSTLSNYSSSGLSSRATALMVEFAGRGQNNRINGYSPGIWIGRPGEVIDYGQLSAIRVRAIRRF